MMLYMTLYLMLQGMSLLATQYLFNRFSYSLVYCNKVNCIGVQDSLLDQPVRLPTEFFNRGRLDQHRCDGQRRLLAVIEPSGRWMMEGRAVLISAADTHRITWWILYLFVFIPAIYI